MALAHYLPPSTQLDAVTACVGLISDTHYPLRCEQLPPALFEIFAGVDLLLHAGDVGELTVLDQLSQIAPVIAVHGNDEATIAEAVLPYQQVLSLHGRRVLLWHSHYPDRQKEMASRVDDAMVPKLQRTVNRAKRAGATIAVFGHWHIPLIYEQDGVTVVNPGAIASGNFFSRQLCQSVALLFLLRDGGHAIVHIDIATQQPFTPACVWPAGFKATLARFSESIFTPDAEALLHRIRPQLSEALRQALIPMLLPLIQRCWRREVDVISLPMLLENLSAADALEPALRVELNRLIAVADSHIAIANSPNLQE